MKRKVLILLILFSGLVFSQETEKEDIKVGLVLSGGGAKGLAHIGVLKVIEDAGVRIDYIGGTSMGAIIGALYASGYTARQLDSIFNNLDFNSLITDEIPRNAKTFYEKDEAEKYALSLSFDKFKIQFPSGLSKGQNVYNLISKLTSHVNNIDDFNDLPIPFFCVATNIETGKEKILNKGYLPRAITASGAIPYLFSPVKINDSIYVDGGVVNNYPVDEVRAMGADIIIGVDVQDTLKMRKNLNTVFDILVQINSYKTIENMTGKRKKTDIYIQPNIEDFSVVSFAEGLKIIESGTEKALLFKNELKAVAARQKQSPRKQVKIVTSNSFYIKSVEIEGNKYYTRAYVLGKLKLKTPAKISYVKFNEGVNNLSATGNFQDINYRFVVDENEEIIVKFNLRESDSKMLLRLGIHYDDLFRTAALVNITRKRIFTNNDVSSFDFIVGDNIRYNFNYYIDKGFYWSVGLNSRFSSFDTDVTIDFIFPTEPPPGVLELNQIKLEYGDLTNQIFVQTLFKRSYLLGIGVEHKWLRYLSNTIGIDENENPRTIFEDNNYISTFGFLKFDTYDNKFYPKRGFYFEGDFHFYIFSGSNNQNFDQYSIAKAKFGFAKTFFEKFSTILSAEGGLKIGGSSTNSLDFFLGGYGFKQINNIIPFYGYDALSLRGDTYLKSTLTFDYEIFRKNHINISANIANVGDQLFITKGWINSIDNTGYAIGYGFETFIGPIEAKYSFSPERDQGEWYVNVGFSF